MYTYMYMIVTKQKRHLSDVVEVAVRHLFLAHRLLHLVQERVQVELGAEVPQAPEAERLPVT